MPSERDPESNVPAPDESEATIGDLPAEPVSPEDDASLRGGASKYAGEAEKNVDAVFDNAKRTNAKLFFDEGDQLFK